ncbi:MAG: YgiQ family radical SAM protein [Alistipes finegoldii]
MFLPTTIKEVRARGWEQLDVILFSGDAYIDHPAFGAAVIGRLLEAEGYRVAIVPQPNWRDDLRDFTKLGAPRLFFGVSAGSMDSMVNHYTANLRLRSNDAYTPGGKAGFRPDYAVKVYTQILKRLFPHVPVVIGGIEASLRRLPINYWNDTLKPSVPESGADLLIYGMGERRAAGRQSHAERLQRQTAAQLRQVAFMADNVTWSARSGGDDPAARLRGVRVDKPFGENFTIIDPEQPDGADGDAHRGRATVMWSSRRPTRHSRPTSWTTVRSSYERAPHPRYNGKWIFRGDDQTLGQYPPGMLGGCSFCTISAHQGKFINSRSERSILAEVERVTRMPDFKGYLSDVGAPSANMYRMGGRDRELCRKCRRPSCLHPKMCPNLDNDHRPLLALYEKIRAVKGVKKAFVGSGIRYDLFDESPYLDTVVKYHTSGRLKVAPEHTEDAVLKLMRKPPFALFERLTADFQRICRREGLPYQLIPYFISSHPGCTERDMRSLSEKVLGKLHFNLEQVQDLTPTPMTLSSVMFYTGENPYTHEKVYVARSQEEKRRQKSYFFNEKPTGNPTVPERRTTARQERAPKNYRPNGDRTSAPRPRKGENPRTIPGIKRKR